MYISNLCLLLASDQLPPIQMEAEEDPLTEHIWSPVQCYQVFEADPTWVHSTIATCDDCFVVDNMAYMGGYN